MASVWFKMFPIFWVVLRFPVTIYYDDALGPREEIGSHSMLLPHEVVGTFYRFEPVDLMAWLTGKPGDP